ncbi:hypothetical protein HH214_04635 [Mucilaginibacter robiniae]|uniref:Uncharacterized protein n=1 Tax=Mucilaginibacter robiniae TaxID=2728022 RepID=A0A7L5E0Z6_9SPHI|nr:hypothetical protein [Mucilaginibacter robiniae]QJD95214.1 hypothetical protein HH214_04635 [Mucilaginibacter robiniae]
MTEQEEEKRVAAAFNAGYTLQQHEPQLLEKITTDANKQSDFVNYMAMGQRQQKKETLIQQQLKIKQTQRNKKQQRGR